MIWIFKILEVNYNVLFIYIYIYGTYILVLYQDIIKSYIFKIHLNLRWL